MEKQDEFRAPYGILFRAVTRALAQLEAQQPLAARATLVQGQRAAEEAYLAAGEE